MKHQETAAADYMLIQRRVKGGNYQDKDINDAFIAGVLWERERIQKGLEAIYKSQEAVLSFLDFMSDTHGRKHEEL